MHYEALTFTISKMSSPSVFKTTVCSLLFRFFFSLPFPYAPYFVIDVLACCCSISEYLFLALRISNRQKTETLIIWKRIISCKTKWIDFYYRVANHWDVCQNKRSYIEHILQRFGCTRSYTCSDIDKIS